MKRRIGVAAVVHPHCHRANVHGRAFRHFPFQVETKSGISGPGREAVEQWTGNIENFHPQRRENYRAARRSTMTSAIPPRMAREARTKRSVIVSPRNTLPPAAASTGTLN